MHHGTVSCADRLSQGVIAWPQVRRIPMKTSKKSRKKKKLQKIGACGGPWDPISPPHGHPLGPPRRPRVNASPRRQGLVLSGMRRAGPGACFVFSRRGVKAHGLPGALRRPEKAFSLVLLQAAASAPRPASSLEAIRASQRTSAGSVGTGDHGRPQPACLRHRRLTWHRLARSERDPRRSRAAKHVTNSNAVFGAVVAFVTGKAKRPAQSRSAATQQQGL